MALNINEQIDIISDNSSNTNELFELSENDEEFIENRYRELQNNSLYETGSAEKE